MSNPLWNLHCVALPDEDSDFDTVTYWAAEHIAALTARIKELEGALGEIVGLCEISIVYDNVPERVFKIAKAALKV